ncbi:ABC transporter family substrate-binding protein [Streptomyces sp. NBC_01725]|uniref:ABC transporter family substrate-binding protein n=1 Tax=Streptomyces sp. NBC_01725 TaxID=2975923 RepID=UPI002E2DC171|nr:ABC transporter family substrate-binding protein [Streptomyces sp. NBC_01725]
MSKVGAPRGRTCSRTTRSVALITTGVLALPALASCSSGDERSEVPAAAQDVGPAARDRIADGGTLRWAVDTVPTTLNTFQADADATTSRVAGAVLPSLFTLDKTGRPQRNPDYLESAKIVEREPKQVVLYKLNQQAVWSDGRELGAPDFVAQWRALSGKDSAYWTARNAGYERIQKIERGANDLEVRVTFNKPYADWRGLFSPLYPKDVMGAPNAFNDGARNKLKATAGPFQLKELDREDRQVTLVRNPRWWGARPKLDSIVLSAVSRDKRAAALAEGTLDLAEIDSPVAERIKKAAHDKKGGAGPQSGTGPGPGAASPSAGGDSDDEKAEAARATRKKANEALAKYTKEQKGLRAYVVRKSLEPAFTQLALNGETGPLADERVRRAVARALDRQKLADAVLKPLGLPANPPGSHLALAGQHAYADSSDALGEQNTQEAQGLLADAGWVPGGPLKKDDGTKAGSEADADKEKEKEKDENGEATKKDTAEETATDALEPGSGSGSESASDSPSDSASGSASESDSDSASESGSESDSDSASDEGAYIVGDNKPARGTLVSGTGTGVIAPALGTAFQRAVLTRHIESLADSDVNAQDRQPGGGMAGAYAPSGTAAPSSSASGSPSASASTSASASASTSASTSAPTSASASALPGPLAKDGKPLTLRFVLPSGSGSEQLRTVGEKIARMLDRIGIRTEITKVADANYFKDHIASGDYDLALYSWPATAYPATDGRPIYAKPVPASDGSLLVEQNYTRVGTDHINQLFDQAASELDEKAARDLLRQADARIWAAAGSIPLYQRPQLVAAKPSVANAGAFAFASPRYEDIGFKGSAKSGPEKTEKSAGPEKSGQTERAEQTGKPEAAESESDE